jgi:D-alanyl-D-alanine dipeptidase
MNHRTRPRRAPRGATVAVTLTLVLGLAACAAAEGRLGLRDRVTDLASPTAAGLSAADGLLPDGDPVSPFDEQLPAIARLKPDLLAAVQAAATAADADGIAMVVTSGWRSAEYQQRLLDDAVQKYGSAQEAGRWVKSPSASTHVSGDAVDIGYTDAADWLGRHGDDFGLCQTYANEMWHFELATEPGGTCPEQQTDAAG